mmetsp:Transcript_7922/g.11199  ORF Transcript_7922/g.11199 Transcript_7922/m.11199 type:complete len:203 (-) Transcript_7922:560-1168(-)
MRAAEGVQSRAATQRVSIHIAHGVPFRSTGQVRGRRLLGLAFGRPVLLVKIALLFPKNPLEAEVLIPLVGLPVMGLRGTKTLVLLVPKSPRPEVLLLLLEQPAVAVLRLPRRLPIIQSRNALRQGNGCCSHEVVPSSADCWRVALPRPRRDQTFLRRVRVHPPPQVHIQLPAVRSERVPETHSLSVGRIPQRDGLPGGPSEW